MKKFNQYLTIVQENREPINEMKASTFGAIIALLTGLATSPIKGNELDKIQNQIENLSDNYSLTDDEKKEYENVINKMIENNQLSKKDSQELKMNFMGGHRYNFDKNKIKEILNKLKNHLSASK